MYFVIIMAFALVLSDGLPPERCDIFGGASAAGSRLGTLAIALGQLVVIWIVAIVGRRRALGKLDGTPAGHDRGIDTHASFQQLLLYLLAGLLVLTMVFTPWARLVREDWGLGAIPLLGDLLLLFPLFASLIIAWTVFFPLEKRFRSESFPHCHEEDGDAEAATAPSVANHATAALQAAKRQPGRADTSLGGYLLDKMRHQVLILAVPMCIIVLAKHILYGPLSASLPLPADEQMRGLILNSALGTVSVVVLVIAPLLLRYIWATEPLPAGPLRDRFVQTCERIGLRYREILLWHTHGMAVNAAVMGFVFPMRYILVSDALLETMDENEIEAVFGHEAGHVRHWHLPFFGVFAIVSMYAAGGAMHLLFTIGRWMRESGHDPGFLHDDSVLQLVALAVLLAMWLFGFSWLSRKFERQADLFGVRCITPDVETCVAHCPVHGEGGVNEARTTNLCVTAASLFGRTLTKIAELNGIPREAPSWRHGSIASRCRLIERFATDATELRRFDRLILHIKLGLVAIALVGSAAAVWIYYEPVMHALRSSA